MNPELLNRREAIARLAMLMGFAVIGAESLLSGASVAGKKTAPGFSDAERTLAVILDRDALKWFKPAKGQFQIFYRQGADQLSYQPDFVAETAAAIYMLEPKARNQLDDPIVLAKRDAAVKWCANASTHATSHAGKPWRYALIPHDVIAENMTLAGLAARYGGIEH